MDKFEKFKLTKRTVTYTCGCTKEIFGFEQAIPSDTCEQHNTPIKQESNEVDEV